MRRTLGLGLWLALLAWPASLLAADKAEFRTKFDREIAPGRPTLVCTKVDKGPVIDGDVDKDPVWQACSRTHGAWVQLARKDVSGRQSVVYSCYDKENLYFAFVCEESELGNVRMDGVLTQSFQPAGPDDCVEAIIEVGSVQGDGEVYSFRANSRAHLAAWGLSGIPAEYAPVWQSVGKFGPNRWMLEMAIPFASLKRGLKGGLATPSRGDVLGLKLVRYGAAQQDVKNRMVSTWNTEIAFVTPYIAGSDGLLYFEDSNSLQDGNFGKAAKDSPWERKGQVEGDGRQGVQLGKDASITQTMDVHPGSFYMLSVASEGSVAQAMLDGKTLAIKDGRAGFWTGDKQKKVSLTLTATEPMRIKEALVQHQPGEKRPGPQCLTNNYRHAERNIRTAMPGAPDGQYQYVLLDYQNRTIGDGNPANRIRGVSDWAYDYNLRMEDVGGQKGWIPFAKGSLTGRAEGVFWQTANPGDPSCWGRLPKAVEVDLGQEYFVSDLDLLLPAPNMTNLEIWGKLKAQDSWTLLHVGNGQFVEPSRRRDGRRAYESVVGLDSVVRHLMWRFTQAVGTNDFPQMDGIQQFWVWGEPKGDRTGIKPFQAWITNDNAPKKKWETTAPDPEACQILPRPRKMSKADGWFIIGPRTRIVAQREPEARKVAGQIHDEIMERWQIDVPVEDEQAEPARLDDVVYVGEPKLGKSAAQLWQADGPGVPRDKPQAYALSASRQRVVVLGADDQGLYWGVQSLMLAMRWHSSKDPAQNGLGVRCMKIEDWPATLDRSTFFPEGTLFTAIESEIPRIVSNVHLQARFKWNAAYTALSEPPMPWAPGRVAEVCRQVREQHHMEVRPMLFEPPNYYIGGWNKIVAAAGDLSTVERDPDDAAADLGASVNMCPLNPRTYSLINARLDELLEQYDWPSKIWMGGLVNHNPLGGARWGACPQCKKSGKSGDELMACFAEQIGKHLRKRNATAVVEPHAIAFGDRDDPKWKRALVAADVRSLPADYEYILPDGFSPQSCEALRSRLNPSLTAGGPMDWPSAERIFRGGMGSDLGTIASFGPTYHLAGMILTIEGMWYGPDKPPAEDYDFTDLHMWGNAWKFKRDLPSWRAGDRPEFFPIDLRSFVNHTGQPTAIETLEAGRVAEMDLNYVPKGRQVLSGVAFDIIDPASNNGKSVLMLGRPLPGATHPKDAANVAEEAGPIPVGRKLASLAFLRTSWQASTQDFQRHDRWLLPTCRIVYDDDTWLPADCFRVWEECDYWNMTAPNTCWAGCPTLLERVGWLGNCPSGPGVLLKVVEWVNPYPSKTIKSLQFMTPAYADWSGGKRANPQCHAIIAMTGVEPIEQDFSYWSKRADRPPLLPPIKAPRQKVVAIERTGYGEAHVVGGDRYMVRLKAAAGDATMTLELTPGAGYTTGGASTDCGEVLCNTGYKTFGVIQTLEPAMKLCRVDIRGPSYGVDHEYSVGRNHRVDVTVEVTQDGVEWRKIGELKGISGDCDFLPLEFEPTLVKKLRISATAAPYHLDYSPSMANPIAGPDYPYFAWRLLAPAEATRPGKP